MEIGHQINQLLSSQLQRNRVYTKLGSKQGPHHQGSDQTKFVQQGSLQDEQEYIELNNRNHTFSMHIVYGQRILSASVAIVL